MVVLVTHTGSADRPFFGFPAWRGCLHGVDYRFSLRVELVAAVSVQLESRRAAQPARLVAPTAPLPPVAGAALGSPVLAGRAVPARRAGQECRGLAGIQLVEQVIGTELEVVGKGLTGGSLVTGAVERSEFQDDGEPALSGTLFRRLNRRH